MFHMWTKPDPVRTGRRSMALLIDEDPGFRKVALRILSRTSVAGVAVSGIAAAVTWLRLNDTPTLVFVDHSGVRAVRAALGGRITAVVATAAAGVDRNELLDALQAGAAGALVKPLDPNEMLRTVFRHVSTAP